MQSYSMTKIPKMRMFVAGGRATGKSCFIRRWGSSCAATSGELMFRPLTTEGGMFTQRQATIEVDEDPVELTMCEPPIPSALDAGKFVKLLHTIDVYLLTYSVVNRTSLEYLTHFMDMIPKCLGYRPIMIIVGTMIDRKDRQLSSFVDHSCTVPQVVEEAIRVRRRDKTTPSRLDLDDSMSITSDYSSYYGYKKRTSIDSDTSQWSASSSDSGFSDESIFDRSSAFSDCSSPPSTPCSSGAHFDFRAGRASNK